MTDDQLHFLRLHQYHSDWVEETRHIFQGAMVRVKTHRGKCATLAVDLVQRLVDTGLMVPSYGGSFVLTDAGKAI